MRRRRGSYAPNPATKPRGITVGPRWYCPLPLAFGSLQAYSLYLVDGQWQLSLIAPEEWGARMPGAFVGQCKLRHDMTWSVEFDESVAEDSPVHDALLQYLDGIHEQLQASGSWEALLRNGERHLPYQQRVLTTGLASSLRQSLALSGQSGVPLSVPLLQETLSLPQQPD